MQYLLELLDFIPVLVLPACCLSIHLCCRPPLLLQRFNQLCIALLLQHQGLLQLCHFLHSKQCVVWLNAS